MKFLSVPSLEKYSVELSHMDLGDMIIHGRIEAYSCKPTDDEKKLHKQLNRHMDSMSSSPVTTSLMSHSPKIMASSSPHAAALLNTLEPLTSSPSPSMHAVHSGSAMSMSSNSNDKPAQPLSNLADVHTRKLLVQLITTMNNAFADYDFSANIERIASKFVYEQSTQSAITTINNLFLNTVDAQYSNNFRSDVWRVIDECIELDKCEVYSYVDDNELMAGKLWFINYFFYNKKLKKIVFLEAHAVNKLHRDSQLDNDNSADSSMFAMRQFNTADSQRLKYDVDNDTDGSDDDSDVAPHIDADDADDDVVEHEYKESQQANKSLSNYTEHQNNTTLTPMVRAFNVDRHESFKLDGSNVAQQPSGLSKSLLSQSTVTADISHIPKPTGRRS